MPAAQLAGGDDPGDRDEWDADAHAARFLAAVDAGLIEVPAEGAGWQGVSFSLAETDDPAVLDAEAFTQGGAADQLPPGAVLAALAQAACDPAVLAGLTDNAVLGVVAGSRRLAGRAGAIQLAAVAEYAGRHLETDRKKASRMGFTAFAADDLAPELMVSAGSAEVLMCQSRDVTRRLPATAAAQWAGLITDFPVKIIAEATVCLSDAGAAEADAMLAVAAPGLTPGQLRAMAARVVMMIDPQAAEQQRQLAAKGARVEKNREWAGTASLAGRDLPPDAVLRSWQHIDAAARALRKQGAPGTLEQLRAAVYLGLTAAMDPLEMLERILTAAGEADQSVPGAAGRTGTGAGAAWPWDRPDEDEAHPAAGPDGEPVAGSGGPGDDDDEGDLGDGQDDGDGDGPGGIRRGGADPHGPGGPGGPAGGAATGLRPGHGGGSGAGAPFQATITLLVPVGTPYGWSSAPARIPGYGPVDAHTTQDLIQAASRHPATRWCITLIGDDGTAVAHGCAPGTHPWTPPAGTRDPNRQRTGGGERDGPGDPRDGTAPGPGTTAQQQAAEFLSGLRAKLSPIAAGECDHASYTSAYVVPRTLKHLIKARRATCIAPCCNRSAADGDADHTIPWPQGPTCQHNLGAPCRYHHRNKQAPGWNLEQTQPGIFQWHAPSGRTRTTHPDRYLT